MADWKARVLSCAPSFRDIPLYRGRVTPSRAITCKAATQRTDNVNRNDEFRPAFIESASRPANLLCKINKSRWSAYANECERRD